ncbi:MAG: DNA alkylation repair protein [Deltaproteobacteria bacterium]|nr:DNA alkylation repair protein [Deltaproteobacteria bacterium]
MHAHHRVLLGELQKHRRNRVHPQSNDSYLSSGHLYLDVPVPTRRTLAKAWLKENQGIPDAEFLAVVESLYRGMSYEEKTLASILLSYHRAGRQIVGLKRVSTWLDDLVGWAEIDTLCSGVFTADEILANWRAWERLIRGLARGRNINKRRAALVFLTAPVRYSDDKRLSALSFEVIRALQPEREKIITKAVSWLLRSMVRYHKREVSAYLKNNQSSLPAVAVRETKRKIATGRK